MFINCEIRPYYLKILPSVIMAPNSAMLCGGTENDDWRLGLQLVVCLGSKLSGEICFHAVLGEILVECMLLLYPEK